MNRAGHPDHASAASPPASAPARVLWISCVGEKGGAEVYLLNFLRHLDRSRFEPEVALLRPGPFEADLRAAGITVHVLRQHRMRNVAAVARSILALRAIARDRRIRLVHSNAFRAHPYGGLAARLLGRPAVWSVHTPEQPTLSTRAILRIPVHAVSANCPRTADWYAARQLPVHLIWPPVDLDRLTDQTPRAALASRYQLPLHARWLVTASRLQRYKGHAYLIRALAQLPPELTTAHAVIVGGTLFGMEQDYAAELRRLALDLGVADRVHLTGFVPDADLHGLLAAAEVVVHPALDEDFGLVVAEAQALARPVVAFNAVGPAAIVEPGRSGELVPVADLPALTRALVEVLTSSEERRQELGRVGRDRVSRLFSARTAGARLGAVYNSLLNARPLALDAERQPIPDPPVA